MKRTSLAAMGLILLAGAASAAGFRAGTITRFPGNSFRVPVQLHATDVKPGWTAGDALRTKIPLGVMKLDKTFNPAPDMILTQPAEEARSQDAMPLLQDVADKTISFDAAFDGRTDVKKTEDAVFGGESRNTVSLGRRTNIVQEKTAGIENIGRRGIAGKALGLTALLGVLSQSLFAAQTTGIGHVDNGTIIFSGLVIGGVSTLIYALLILPMSARRTEARLRAVPGVTSVETDGDSYNGQTGFRVTFKDKAAYEAAKLPYKLNGWYIEQYVGDQHVDDME